MNPTIDILMITYNRPKYTAISLKRLLETCDKNMRVWVWQNGSDKETMDVVESFRSHPRFHQYYHSPENKKLTEPTNWLWSNSDAQYFSKVDDDCLMPYGWAETLIQAHREVPEFGILGCWLFREEDLQEEIAAQKIQEFAGGHKVMRNCWVGGSGYAMKRSCYDLLGQLRSTQSFPDYCIQLALRGYVIGYYYPFLYQDHFDDPRSSYTMLKTDADLTKWLPLTAQKFGIVNLEGWKNKLHQEAVLLQKATWDPRSYTGWRHKVKKIMKRCQRTLGVGGRP